MTVEVQDLTIQLKGKFWHVDHIEGSELAIHLNQLRVLVPGLKYRFARPIASGAYSMQTGVLGKGLEFVEATFLGVIRGHVPIFAGIPSNNTRLAKDSRVHGWKWLFSVQLGPGGVEIASWTADTGLSRSVGGLTPDSTGGANLFGHPGKRLRTVN